MNGDRTGIGKDLKNALGQIRHFLKWTIPALLLFYLADGFYSIKTNELGVREFMGKVVDRQVLPGLHYNLPRPFSRIYKVPVLKAKSLVVDDFYQDQAPGSRAAVFYDLTGLESYSLSGDNNVVEARVAVHYRNTDPFNYLFGAAQKETLLRDIVCREIIHLLSVRPIDLILSRGREEIRELLHSGIQEKLDLNRTGISVDRVEIQEIRPPAAVQAYFDDVINAQIDKKQMESRARSYATAENARARAEGDRLEQESAAYRNRAVQAAAGESARFLDLLEEYRKVPGITRKRLYLEFARETLSRLKNTFLLDQGSGGQPPLLRILP